MRVSAKRYPYLVSDVTAKINLLSKIRYGAGSYGFIRAYSAVAFRAKFKYSNL